MDVRTNHRALTIVTTTLRRVFSLGLLPHEGGVMPTTAFDPTVHGFGFDDRFVNVVALLPGGLKLRTKGRCGGMTYAALDYFHLGRGAPTYVPSPPARVPPDRHPLANHLLRRQLEELRQRQRIALRHLDAVSRPRPPVRRGRPPLDHRTRSHACAQRSIVVNRWPPG